MRSDIKGADMTVQVPSCADWNVGQLVRHLGGAHRSAEAQTLIHRADAALALGMTYTVDPDLAVDAIDEWMQLTAMLVIFEIDPGRNLHFHATTPHQRSPRSGRSISPATSSQGIVVVRRRLWSRCGDLWPILLVCYRRLPVRRNGIAIVGDSQLLDLWLEAVPFGCLDLGFS
ncbi:maleylpyruvate isomerase N-terminal domain-containing protein [Actinopolymorpha sp. B11F2]|uniref:maleylpyruvate isomerase N-terminal domain-containing protein n=1 Tax=Actinopolymorpha sp. B11F2 TaxID=3160862 RepID=UPI0032E43EE8